MTKEARAVIEIIKREIDKANINIFLEYLNNKPRPNKTFH